MIDFKNRLLEKYNSIISELEQIDSESREELNNATMNKSVPQAELIKIMSFARDNHRRLQFARAEKELIQKY
jgi:uncharacterized protein YlxP (DUF503 family)